MNAYCASEGIGLIPWSPLARGFLAGNRGEADRKSDSTVATEGKVRLLLICVTAHEIVVVIVSLTAALRLLFARRPMTLRTSCTTNQKILQSSSA